MLSNLKFIWLLGKNGDVFAFVVKINIKFGPKHSPDGLHKTLLGLNRDFIVILTLSSFVFYWLVYIGWRVVCAWT